MEKSIEQIMQLSKNPNYVLTEEEIKKLREYQKQNLNENHTNKNRVRKNSSPAIKKHETEVTE